MTNASPPRFVLASASPRRLDLLAGIGLTPDIVDPAKVDEVPARHELPRDHAARMADRQAELHDKAIAVIDEALDRFRDDMRATKPVKQPDGTITEVPAWCMTPKDLCLLSTASRCCSGAPPSSASTEASPCPRSSRSMPSASSSSGHGGGQGHRHHPCRYPGGWTTDDGLAPTPLAAEPARRVTR